MRSYFCLVLFGTSLVIANASGDELKVSTYDLKGQPSQVPPVDGGIFDVQIRAFVMPRNQFVGSRNINGHFIFAQANGRELPVAINVGRVLLPDGTAGMQSLLATPGRIEIASESDPIVAILFFARSSQLNRFTAMAQVVIGPTPAAGAVSATARTHELHLSIPVFEPEPPMQYPICPPPTDCCPIQPTIVHRKRCCLIGRWR